MTTNENLRHRDSRWQPMPLGTGAASFKRLLGSMLTTPDVAAMARAETLEWHLHPWTRPRVRPADPAWQMRRRQNDFLGRLATGNRTGSQARSVDSAQNRYSHIHSHS